MVLCFDFVFNNAQNIVLRAHFYVHYRFVCLCRKPTLFSFPNPFLSKKDRQKHLKHCFFGQFGDYFVKFVLILAAEIKCWHTY